MSITDYPAVGARMTASCPETTWPCGNDTTINCYEGICCQRDTVTAFCACRDGYEGEDCSISTLFLILQSRENAMRMISLSSGISIAVGIIALLALGMIIFVIVRSSRKRRYWGLEPVDPEKDLDKTIVYVQEEISKLSTVQQLNKLHRLSKLFEKTVREAILSEPGQREEQPQSVVMNEYLPRWSSAPTCINRPPNDLDMTDGPGSDDEVFQKPRLQQVFSLQ